MIILMTFRCLLSILFIFLKYFSFLLIMEHFFSCPALANLIENKFLLTTPWVTTLDLSLLIFFHNSFFIYIVFTRKIKPLSFLLKIPSPEFYKNGYVSPPFCFILVISFFDIFPNFESSFGVFLYQFFFLCLKLLRY